MTVTDTTKSASKKPRFFDVTETSKLISAGLENLKASQKPGQVTGKGTKDDVLKMHEQAIKELHDLGYSAKQIADAISKDTFSILPKTITHLLGLGKANKTTQVQPKKAAKAKATVADKTAQTPVKAAANTKVSGAQKTMGGDVE